MGVFGLISEAAESGFVEKLTEINSAINDFAWVRLGLVLLLGAGVLLTVCTKFFQVVHIKEWWMKTIGGMFSHKSKVRKNKEEGSVSQFQALCTALAATYRHGKYRGRRFRNLHRRSGRGFLDVDGGFFRYDDELFRKYPRSLLPPQE